MILLDRVINESKWGSNISITSVFTLCSLHCASCVKEALVALPLPSKKLHGNLDQDPYEHAFTTGSDILICAITAAYLRPSTISWNCPWKSEQPARAEEHLCRFQGLQWRTKLFCAPFWPSSLYSYVMRLKVFEQRITDRKCYTHPSRLLFNDFPSLL